jgi:hypothetical protein
MKKTYLSAITMFMILALAGCGHDRDLSPTIVTQILSDPVFDGYITQTSSTTFTVTQGMTLNPPPVQSLFAGIDPATLDESRAFLDFSLTGANGVPGNAVIVSATLDIVIDNVVLQSPGDTVPIRIELVSTPTLSLVQDDFDRTLLPALAFTTITPPISSTDVNNHVFVDVTSLMVQAQNLGLLDFQVRILEDDSVAAPPGLIEIDDTTGSNRAFLAPLLQVEYF